MGNKNEIIVERDSDYANQKADAVSRVYEQRHEQNIKWEEQVRKEKFQNDQKSFLLPPSVLSKSILKEIPLKQSGLVGQDDVFVSERFIGQQGRNIQDQFFPPLSQEIDCDIEIVGAMVSGPYSYQFIFSNEKHSMFAAGKCGRWIEFRKPANSIVKKVEMMFCKENSLLLGFRFLSSEKKELLACGMINNRLFRNSNLRVVKKFILEYDQSIVGVKSYSREANEAIHSDFQFVISQRSTKLLLLKLLSNRNNVKEAGRSIGQLPTGVFREVINYVKFNMNQTVELD